MCQELHCFTFIILYNSNHNPHFTDENKKIQAKRSYREWEASPRGDLEFNSTENSDSSNKDDNMFVVACH